MHFSCLAALTVVLSICATLTYFDQFIKCIMMTPLDVSDKTVCKQKEKTVKSVERRQTDLIQEYRSEKNDLDAQRESEIRGKVQWLIQKLLSIEEAVQTKLNCLEIPDKSLIKKNDFIEIWIKCKEIRYDAAVCIETFFEDCYSCEKKYSMKAEKLIKHHYETLRRLINNFPKEMFEQDILNMNAQFLNNIREYANFSRHVVLYQLSKLLKIKLSLASKLESWISVKAQEAERLNKAVPKIASTEGDNQQRRSERVSQSYIQKQKQKVFLNFLCGERRGEFMWDYFLDETTEDWPDQLQSGHCDFALELLIKTYSIAKTKSLEALRLLIDSFDTVCSESSQAEQITTDDGSREKGEQQQHLLQTSANEEEENPLNNIHYKIRTWYNDTCKMQRKIGKSYRFMADFAKIWTEHLQRMKDTKSLIAMVLGKDVETQLERRRSNQAGILMAIANIRVEYSEKCMDQHLQKISKLILDIEQSCRDELSEEISILGRFREFAKLEGRLLGAEFVRLQEKYNFETQITYFSDQNNPVDAEHVAQLPKHLQLCDFHTNAMENWNCALMQEISKYHQICERDVSIRMESWLVDESYGLLDRLDGYIHMESKQYDRIVEQVYNVRLIELKNHQMLLELHKNAVESYLSQIFQDLEHFVSIFSEIIESTRSYFDEVEITAAESENSSLVDNLIIKINNKRIKEEKIFESSVIHFKEQCDRKFRYLQECQLNFIKSLRMFSEGGTYSSEETQVFLNELANVDKLIITKQSAFDNELNNCCVVLTQDMNECYSGIGEYLMNVVNELKFAEETALILSEAEKTLKIMFRDLQKDGNSTTEEFKNIILILLNELQASPSPHLLEILENFMRTSRKRALILLSPHSRRSVSSIDHHKGKSRSFAKKEKAVRSAHKITVGKSKLTDYRKLFPEYTEQYLEEMPFASTIYKEIGNAVSSLQEKAGLFYTSRNSESSLVKIALPTTYDNFMREYTEIFQNYCKLCLDSCSKETSILFHWLSKLRHAADLYVAKRLIEFHGTKVQKLTKVYNQFESEKADLLQEDKCIRENCKRKLLVVHGYPSNKNLLKDLEQEIESTCSDLEERIGLFITKGRKYLSNIKNRYLDRVIGICKTLEMFQEKIFEADIFCSLTQQLSDSVRETNPSVLGNDVFLPESLKLESDLQYLLNEGIKEGNIAFIKDCLKCRRKALLQEMECEPVDSVTNIKDYRHSQPTKLVFLEPIKIQEVLSSMKKHYLNDFEQYYQKMDFFQTYKNLSYEWMKEWRSSVRAAQTPYCV